MDTNGSAVEDVTLSWLEAAAKALDSRRSHAHKLLLLEYFKQYFIPCLVAAGTMGNLLSTSVLMQKKLRKRSSTHLLVAKCISDTMFLLCFLLLWLQGRGIVLNDSGIWCYILSMVTQATHFQTTWFVFSMALDRYMIICPGTMGNSQCCKRKTQIETIRSKSICYNLGTSVLWAKSLILLICIVAIAVYLNLSLTMGLVIHNGKSACVPLFEFLGAIQVLGYIDLAINVIIPHAGVVIFISASVRRLILYKRSRRRIINNASLTGRSRQDFFPKAECRQTYTVASMCAAYVLLTSPTHAFRIYHTYRDVMHITIRADKGQFFIQHLCQLIYCSSYAFNFVILFAVDALFRRFLKLAISRMRNRLRGICRKDEELATREALLFALEFSSKMARLNQKSLL